MRGSKSHIGPSIHSKPTLPFAQIFGAEDTSDSYSADIEPVQPAPFREPGQRGHRRDVQPPVTLVEGVPTYAYPNGSVPGPKPPRSWTALFSGEKGTEPAWRTSALSVLFRDLSAPPWLLELSPGRHLVLPLALLCAQVLLSTYGDTESLAEVTEYIPPHTRRDLIRWCAIHKPLSSAQLYALCGKECHAGGELIVGPQATLRGDILKKGKGSNRHRQPESDPTESEDGQLGDIGDHMDEWDMPVDAPPPLTTLALVMAPLPSSLLFSLPPTLTHLALLALPKPAPIHRLPGICPLLELLDLSFNKWLSGKDEYGAGPSEGTLNRVEWRRWGHLRILGLRDCGVSMNIVKKINAGRWTDVEVIVSDDHVMHQILHLEAQ